jgi:iron complex outermembrane receptor protein
MMRVARSLLLCTVALTGIHGAALAQTGSADQPGSGAASPAPSGSEPGGANTAAAEPGSGGIEEIVVTAQRRAENLQEVPIAVSAFSAAELENRGITETLDIIQFVPNLFGSNNTGLGSANAYFLRGLGNTETIATFDPPVGTYVDDIYISRQNANNFGFFDVERVEVLRGPQGTLFGRNTTGGAVNIIVRRPGDEVSGFAEVSYGRFDMKRLRGSVNVPFSEGIAVKVSGYYQDDDGYARNVTTGERLNDNDGAGIRGAVRLKISDNVEWNLAATYTRSSAENILNFTCNNPARLNGCDGDGRFISSGFRSNIPGGGTQYTGLAVPLSGRKAGFNQGNEAEQALFSSNLEIRGENHSLSLITGFIDLKQKFALDFFDGRPNPLVTDPFPAVRGLRLGGFLIVSDGQHDQFSQEVKLNGSLFGGLVDYVAGAFLFKERNTTDFADIADFSALIRLPTGVPTLLADRILNNKVDSTAGYAQFDVNLTEQFKVTAGIRYTDEEKEILLFDNRPSCNDGTLEATCQDNRNLFASTGAAIPSRLEAKLWTPRFAVNFEPNEDLLLFASATRGFKSGGWNARVTEIRQFLPFDPEKVWSYEAGFKSDWLDRRLRVNVTGYWMDVTDLQTPSAFVNPTTGAPNFITQNFADYRNRGIEAEITAIPVENLNVYLNVGFQDDKYKVKTGGPDFNVYGVQSTPAQQRQCLTQLAGGQIAGAAGALNANRCGAGIINPAGGIATPVRTPKFSLAGGFTYDFPLETGEVVLTPAVNVTYRSSYEVGTANLSFYDAPTTNAAGATVAPANSAGRGAFITGSRGDAYTLVNASLSLRTEDDRWLLAVECENCLDESYTQSSLFNWTYINAPMTWMVRARRKF